MHGFEDKEKGKEDSTKAMDVSNCLGTSNLGREDL